MCLSVRGFNNNNKTRTSKSPQNDLKGIRVKQSLAEMLKMALHGTALIIKEGTNTALNLISEVFSAKLLRDET
jgi:hypothetical protein